MGLSSFCWSRRFSWRWARNLENAWKWAGNLEDAFKDFAGRSTRGSHFASLSQKLNTWISKSNKDVLYVSLGTHAVLSGDFLSNLAENAKISAKCRIILSLGISLSKQAASVGIESDEVIFFSDYLPRKTLLGHQKWKYTSPTAVRNDLIKRWGRGFLFLGFAIACQMLLRYTSKDLVHRNFEALDSAMNRVFILVFPNLFTNGSNLMKTLPNLKMQTHCA